MRAAEVVRQNLGDSVLGDQAGFRNAFDTLVLTLSSRLFMVNDPVKITGEMNRTVHEVYQLEFDTAQSDLRNVFPQTVLTRRRGSCLGLSLLYLLVAERLDAPLWGVLVPGHFFVRFHRPDTTINIETIKNGQCLGDEWYRERYEVRDGSWYDEMRSLGREEIAGVLYYNVANVLRERGALQAAVQCYEKSLKWLPGFAEAWGNMGIALEAMGETQRALQAMEKARDLDPELTNISRNIGALQLRLARDREAVEEYEKSVAADGADADALYGLALALLRTDRREESARRAREALGVRPGMPEAEELLRQLAQGDVPNSGTAQ